MLDYFMLDADVISKLIDSPFSQTVGQENVERIRLQIESYEYYDGKQHLLDGVLVYPDELPRPPGLDYNPARFYTNYFKTFIQKKARWQMGGEHKIHVPPKQYDSQEERVSPNYEPSTTQRAENVRAEEYEKLLYKLWDENRMREKLMQAAKDRLIAGRVTVKIVFHPRTGRLRWVFVPDYECIPVYSQDDFEDLEAVHFIKYLTDDNGETKIRKQSYTLEYSENGSAHCYIEEGIYDDQLEIVKVIQKKESMGLDFIPVVFFPIEDLTTAKVTNDEINDMRQLTDVLNQMNEDSIDALKFEMFPITAFLNVPEGTTDNINVSAGATIEITTGGIAGDNNAAPNIKKIESAFTWSTALTQTYDRMKGALHEVTSVPNIIPQEMNFGGLNAEAMRVLFHAIITETEEQWLVWGSRLSELHDKSARYLQARIHSPRFSYDKTVVEQIGDDYYNEMRFALPLPDNRKELVDLLAIETASGFESLAGAMARLGVENVTQKAAEITNEQQQARRNIDPYADMESGGATVLPEDDDEEETT